MSCFIVPPHMLEQISENGSPEERRSAISTLALSERFRARRQLLAALFADDDAWCATTLAEPATLAPIVRPEPRRIARA